MDLLLQMLDDGYDSKDAWHGAALRTAIGRTTAEEAAWRTAEGERNIWEIVVHAAYWKYAVWRRLTGAKRGSFHYKGSDWFTRPEDGITWKSDLILLQQIHDQLREAVSQLNPDSLSDPAIRARVIGIALHDVYHAGQIVQLRSLIKRGETP